MKGFSNQTVLLTGGTGSFGRAFAERVIQLGLFKKVIIFSRDEWKQWEMRTQQKGLQDPKMRYFIGNIRDVERLKRALEGVDIVIHAAALKQIDAAEYNPTEFIKTNVFGAMNITEAAIDLKIKKVLAISTDKAVNPINLYGATKLCQDKLILAANNYVGSAKCPRFSVVRYGNVAGSRGSVIPLWEKLLASGETKLPLTDPSMSRFWLTLEQAVSFVLFALEQMEGGEIFIPKLPSFYIQDIQKALDPNASLEITGIRPGEKREEVLLSQDESAYALDFGDHFRLFLPFSFQEDIPTYQKKLDSRDGEPLPHDFSYSSATNPHILSVAEIRELLKVN